jgi:hypothetical protein
MSTEISGLAGEIIAFTYPSIIKVADNQLIPTVEGGNRNTIAIFKNDNRGDAGPSALARLTDGSGNLTSLAIGQKLAGAKVFGPTIIEGDRQGGCDDMLLDVLCGGVRIEDNICVRNNGPGADTNFILGKTCMDNVCVSNDLLVTNNATVSGAFRVEDNIVQTDGSCSVTFNGDLFVGDDPSGRCFSVDSTSGLLFSKGAANIGDSCSSSSITLTNKGVLQNCGVIRGDADIIAFYSSDKRLKDNITKITDTNSIINGLTGYKFEWKENADRQGVDMGVIAQDVKEVLPEIVHERKDGYLAIDYVKLIPVLIEEVKSLNNRIKALEDK